MEAMVEIESLTKRFGPITAVNDVSFTVGRGEVLGFLGPNGAGKSTTMKMLTGFLAPPSGTARINGHDVVSDALAARGFLVTAIRPPTVPEGTSRLRFTFSATHGEKDVNDLIAAVRETGLAG